MLIENKKYRLFGHSVGWADHVTGCWIVSVSQLSLGCLPLRNVCQGLLPTFS